MSDGTDHDHREVRPATPDDLSAIAASLVRAFHDDPVTRWLVPDDRTWHARGHHLFGFAAREHLRAAAVWTTPDAGATAIWGPPGWHRSRLREALAAPRLAGLLGRRSLQGLRLDNAVRRAHPDEPHWYLAVLGTDPAHQGKGLGGAVLAPVLRRCDEDGVGAYLESSKESNVAWYRRHGFEVTGELQLTPEAPVLYLMWREPRP